MRTCGDMPNCGGEMRVEPLYSRLIPRGSYTHTPLEQLAGVSWVATLIVSTFVLFLLLNVILQRLSFKCYPAKVILQNRMSGMLLACSMLMSDASLSWERPTDPPGRPAKPWKRLCSPVKQNPDWGFLVFIPRHCEIHRFEKRPRSAGSWELATGIVYKWGAKYAHPQKKRQHNVFSADSSIQQKREAMKGWRREDPFFVWWQNGGLLRDGMVIAWGVTCYKGRTKEDWGYVSVHGPLGTLWWLPPVSARLGTPWMNNPPSGCKVVLDS